MGHIFNLSTPEEEAGVYVWVPGQPGLYTEFQASQEYKVRPCLKKKEPIHIQQQQQQKLTNKPTTKWKKTQLKILR